MLPSRGSQLKIDIATLIVMSIICIIFFNYIFMFVSMFFKSLATAETAVTSFWSLGPEGGIFYRTYSMLKPLFDYVVSIGTSKFAVAVLIAVSIIETAFELST